MNSISLLSPAAANVFNTYLGIWKMSYSRVRICKRNVDAGYAKQENNYVMDQLELDLVRAENMRKDAVKTLLRYMDTAGVDASDVFDLVDANFDANR